MAHTKQQTTSGPAIGGELPTAPVAQFEIHYTQFLDHLGIVAQPLPPFARDPQNLIPLYRAMVLTRLFDRKATALQRTGQLGTYASSLGQEAISVALGSVMRPEDVLLPSYRECGAQFLRGVPMKHILLFWGGDERGMDYPKPRHDFPMCIPVASQAPHAVGVAFAIQLRKEARVAVCVLGDGASSKGDFYEAINLAGVWQLPVIFIISDNQWAISVPRQAQSRAQTLAQKAIAAGFPGEQVDGNDVIAVRTRVGRALDGARKGEGPRLIEAMTYRMCDHTTADDASRYRSDQKLAQQELYDPIKRLYGYLTASGAWTDQDEQDCQAASAAKIDEAVKDYLSTESQPPESIFDYLYESLPTALVDQRQAVRTPGINDG